MNQSKLESDIVILDDLLLKEQRDIIAIENQLEISELNATGEDYYFDWRKKAITAINMKRAKCNSISRQRKYWKAKLFKLNQKENLKQRKTERELKIAAHGKIVKEQKEASLKREKEKTIRHKASEERQVNIAIHFKRLVKSCLGEDKYIQLIREAEKQLMEKDGCNEQNN